MGKLKLFWNTYGIVFVFALLTDFWLAATAWFVNHDYPTLLFLFNATYPIINMFGLLRMVEEKDLSKRWYLMATTGLGYGVGSCLFYYTLGKSL